MIGAMAGDEGAMVPVPPTIVEPASFEVKVSSRLLPVNRLGARARAG